jgi:hypothetical protein
VVVPDNLTNLAAWTQAATNCPESA